MASFNRQDYRRIFEIGKNLWYSNHRRPWCKDAQIGIELMEMSEGCLGQQIDFPENARNLKGVRSPFPGKK